MPIGTYTPPPPANHYTKFFFKFIYLFISFLMYIVTNKSQKMFFRSISILGRSGVKMI